MNRNDAGTASRPRPACSPQTRSRPARRLPTGRPLPFAAAVLLALLASQATAGVALAASELDFAREEAEKNALRELYRDIPAASAKGNQTCLIAVGTSGVIAPNIEATELSSKGYGGAPGSVDVLTSAGSFSLVVEAPLGFSLSPVGGNDDVTFSASYSGFGATAFSEQPGKIPVRLKNGLTSIQTHLVATRASGLFPSGLYRADLIVRCE